MSIDDVVVSGAYDTFNDRIVFTKTYAECEAVDFHHSGIIPKDYIEKVESNEYKYFYIINRKEVQVWDFRWNPDRTYNLRDVGGAVVGGRVLTLLKGKI